MFINFNNTKIKGSIKLIHQQPFLPHPLDLNQYPRQLRVGFHTRATAHQTTSPSPPHQKSPIPLALDLLYGSLDPQSSCS